MSNVTSQRMHRLMMILFRVSLFSLALVPGLVLAQNQKTAAAPSASMPLSFPQCVEMTKTRNSELRAAESAYRASREGELGTSGGYFPKINATVGAVRTKANTKLNQDPNFSAGLELSQNLFDGFADMGRHGEQKAKTAIALAKLEAAKAKASYDLKWAYQHLVWATDNVKLTDEIVSRRQNNLRLVDLRFQSGRENRGSVSLSRAYLAEAKLDSLKARNSILKARAHLARTIGLDEDESIQVQGEVPIREAEATTPNFRKLAMETPDHKRMMAEVEEAAQRVEIAKSGWYPKLNASAQINRIGEEFFPQGREDWSVGLNLTFPLFNGFRDYSSTRSTIEARSEKEASRMHVDRDMLAKLRTAYADYVEAVAKLKVDENFRDAAGLRAEIARNRYNNGLLSFEDWDGIENDLINRQKNYLESKRERVLKEAAWDQAQGQGAF